MSNNLVPSCRFKAHNLPFCPLYMIHEICFLQKYDSWKLQLELWNTNHKSLDRTLVYVDGGLLHMNNILIVLYKQFHFLDSGRSMNILRVGNKWPMERGFFTNSAGNLLPTLGFLGGLYNFSNFVIIFSLM